MCRRISWKGGLSHAMRAYIEATISSSLSESVPSISKSKAFIFSRSRLDLKAGLSGMFLLTQEIIKRLETIERFRQDEHKTLFIGFEKARESAIFAE